MKKIMSNDSVGLTKAILARLKTKTRRVATYEDLPEPFDGWLIEGKDAGKRFIGSEGEIKAISHYSLNEVVAIAQSYEDVYSYYTANGQYAKSAELSRKYLGYAGWENKMFVSPCEMPHHIKITNIHVEKLQDIDAKDCLCEGVFQIGNTGWFTFYGARATYRTPVAAFKALIEKLCRKMWAANPYVWVYDFELFD